MEPRDALNDFQVPPPGPKDGGSSPSLISSIRTRVISGLVIALPIVLTFWIVFWLYATFQGLVLDPMASLYRYLYRLDPPIWWERLAAPIVAGALILFFLYVLGLFVRSSLLRTVDWMLLRLPVITTIYKALSNVFRSLGDQMQNQRPQRVVLIPFPHPGSRALAFVTNALQDVSTGKTILSVCVLTGVMPPAGFTLFVPEESVIDVGWTVNQALQAILSGGITTPGAIHYYEGVAVPPTAGPIIDAHGKPIAPLQESGEAVG